MFGQREPTQKPKSHFDFVSNYLVGVYCEGETDVTFIGEILNQLQFVDAPYIRQVNIGGTSKSAYHKLISHLKERINFVLPETISKELYSIPVYSKLPSSILF